MTAWTEDITSVVGSKAPAQTTSLLDGSKHGDVSGYEAEDGVEVVERAAADADGVLERVSLMRDAKGEAVELLRVHVAHVRPASRIDTAVAAVGAVVGFAFAVALAFAVASLLPHGGWQRLLAGVLTIVVWPIGAALFIAPVDAVRRRAFHRREDAALEKYGRARFEQLVASVRARLTP